MMNEKELAEIKARVQMANEGPWKVLDIHGLGDIGDLVFCAHARTDVPNLIAELERLTAENAGLRAALEKYADKKNWFPNGYIWMPSFDGDEIAQEALKGGEG